eukprot:TRINITY_DN8982_c0_g2_i1.p2 TRINITY_DN8982_c0_g2~~TRINITY_DN8982_c0_g2_i1.p2  ORF type:complete len:196 (-),score=10.62 TRINITY_DN8982_c0_g2_i1:579-1166(-)
MLLRQGVSSLEWQAATDPGWCMDLQQSDAAAAAAASAAAEARAVAAAAAPAASAAAAANLAACAGERGAVRSEDLTLLVPVDSLPSGLLIDWLHVTPSAADNVPAPPCEHRPGAASTVMLISAGAVRPSEPRQALVGDTMALPQALGVVRQQLEAWLLPLAVRASTASIMLLDDGDSGLAGGFSSADGWNVLLLS